MKERNAQRLDQIETTGNLEIPRAPDRSYIGRVIASIAIGLLGVAALVMGADGHIMVLSLLWVVVFCFVMPVVIAKRKRQDYLLELTPNDFTLYRWIGMDKERVHRVAWRDVVYVGTTQFGKNPQALHLPSVVALGASGTGHRPPVRTLFKRELEGERITLNQPMEVGRWELVDLLDAATERFREEPRRKTGRPGTY